MGVGEERVIIFDNDGIVQLKRGVIVVIEGDKFEVHSSDRKEVVYFDKEGNFVDKQPTIFESHGYNDFGCLKYFEKIGKKERKIVKHWIKYQEAKNETERAFLQLVNEAIKEIQYGYHIATIEASFDGNKIYYCENNKSSIELSKEEWNIKAEEFAPQYKSKVASLYELCYWYAYKVANRDWDLVDVYNAPQKNIIVLRGI